MPGYDRTGPMGEGPRTGRGLGRCNGHQVEGEHHHEHDEYPIRRRLRDGSCHYGRGRGLGRGFGRGLGRGIGRGFRRG